MKNNKLTRLTTLAFHILLPLSIFAMAGCMVGGIKKDPTSNEASNIVRLVERGELTAAYSRTHSLYMRRGEEGKIRALDLMEKHPQIADGAAQFFTSQFKGSAIQHETLEDFRASVDAEYSAFKNLTSTINTDDLDTVLKDAFQDSRKNYPIRLPAAALEFGMDREAFTKKIPKAPVAAKVLVAPDDKKLQAEVYEYKFTPPEPSTSTDSYSYWFAFMNDELQFVGVGTIREAEYDLYSRWVGFKLDNKEINKSTSQKLIYSKYQELYGMPDPLTNEYVTYSIMVAEQLDNKKITTTEAEYMLAKKRSEIDEKMKALQAQQAEQQRQQEILSLQKRQLQAQQDANDRAHAMARSQLLLQGGLGLMQLQQNERLINSVNQPKTIMPFGQGWIVR